MEENFKEKKKIKVKCANPTQRKKKIWSGKEKISFLEV